MGECSKVVQWCGACRSLPLGGVGGGFYFSPCHIENSGKTSLTLKHGHALAANSLWPCKVACGNFAWRSVSSWAMAERCAGVMVLAGRGPPTDFPEGESCLDTSEDERVVALVGAGVATDGDFNLPPSGGMGWGRSPPT